MDAGAKAADGHVTFTAGRSRHTKKKKKTRKKWPIIKVGDYRVDLA
jgi:hypothetical protein